jgi:hypothetical protein
MNGASFEKFHNTKLRKIVNGINANDAIAEHIGTYHVYFFCHRQYGINHARKIVNNALKERSELHGKAIYGND